MAGVNNAETLRVAAAALHVEADWCESLAAVLAGNLAPPGAVPTPLASSTAVALINAEVDGASAKCTARMRATAAKLTPAGGAYSANEADAATRLHAVAPTTVL